MVHGGQSIGAVLTWMAARPSEAFVKSWNYKSAVLSSLSRSIVFFTVNLAAGPEAAVAAMTTEFVLRFVMAGFYGAATQAFRTVTPPVHGTVAALVLLPAVAHSLEYVVHACRGTAALTASLTASVAFTMVSTAFNLFAMRQGVFVVGEGAGSLRSDLGRIPQLVGSFLGATPR